MPKILETGKLPTEKEYKATCSNCQTKFSFLQKEAHRRYSHRNETYLVVKCPMPGCFKDVYLEI